MFRFKPLIFAVMCIFTLSACETASTPPVDYPVTASYDKTFLKNHSRQSDNDEVNAVGVILVTVAALAVGWLIGTAIGNRIIENRNR